MNAQDCRPSSCLASPHRHPCRPLRQRGQALSEFLVVALALIPLFLLMPVIAKYQDMGHAAQMASRYVAFDGAHRNPGFNAWRSDGELGNDVRRRFFSDSAAPIKTGDTAGDFDAHRNLFWRTPGGNPLLARFSDVSVRTTSTGTQDGTPYMMHGTMGLQAHGIRSGTVTVALANLPAGIRSLEPFDTINLSISRKTSVVVDPWTARSPAQTEDRFGRLVPVNSVLDSGIGDVIGFAITVSELLGQVPPPAFGELALWRDVVPEDRLKPPRSSP